MGELHGDYTNAGDWGGAFVNLLLLSRCPFCHPDRARAPARRRGINAERFAWMRQSQQRRGQSEDASLRVDPSASLGVTNKEEEDIP